MVDGWIVPYVRGGECRKFLSLISFSLRRCVSFKYELVVVMSKQWVLGSSGIGDLDIVVGGTSVCMCI